MTHDFLEMYFAMVLRGLSPTELELNIEQYNQLKMDLERESDFNELLGLKIVIKEIRVYQIK